MDNANLRPHLKNTSTAPQRTPQQHHDNSMFFMPWYGQSTLFIPAGGTRKQLNKSSFGPASKHHDNSMLFMPWYGQSTLFIPAGGKKKRHAKASRYTLMLHRWFCQHGPWYGQSTLFIPAGGTKKEVRQSIKITPSCSIEVSSSWIKSRCTCASQDPVSV